MVGNVGTPRQVMRLYPEGLFIRKTAAGVPLGNSGYGFGRTCGRGVWAFILLVFSLRSTGG